MKKVLLILSLFLASSGIHAQSYTFLVGPSTPYQELDAPTVLTNSSEVWDDPGLTIPVSFPFQFFGNNVTAFYTHLGLGSDLYTEESPDVASSPMISAGLLDIADRGFPSGPSVSSISYQVVGAAGSRILKVQWKNVGLLDDIEQNETSTDFLNFQIWFYETSNKIEMHYGTGQLQDFSFYGNFPVTLVKAVGYQSQLIEDIHYLTGSQTNPSMVVSDDIDQFIENSLTGLPSSGTVYVFNPISSVNVGEVAFNDDVLMFPNPSTDFVTIQSDVTIKNIVIRDVLGREVLKTEIASAPISVASLPTGNYLVELTTEFGTLRKSLIKK